MVLATGSDVYQYRPGRNHSAGRLSVPVQNPVRVSRIRERFFFAECHNCFSKSAISDNDQIVCLHMV